jgi:hypothetical protein
MPVIFGLNITGGIYAAVQSDCMAKPYKKGDEE